MELKTYFAQDASGNIMPGATVMVYEAATTTLATGLQDESGFPLANPFTADNSAKVAFYAPDGLYDITVVGNGRTVTLRAQFADLGAAVTAEKLKTARTIAITGDLSWSTSFDGSGNVTASGTLANSGVTTGTYRSVTVDAKGRVTGGTNPTTLSLLNVRTFSTANSGSTYTPTAGTTSVIVEAVGAGGGGGGSLATNGSQLSYGTGGDCGKYGKARFTSGFSGVTLTIGSGGAGVAGGTGNTGGNTSFGSALICPGGIGGGTINPVGTTQITMYSTSPSPAAVTGANITSHNGFAGVAGITNGLFNTNSGSGCSSYLGSGGSPSTSLGVAGAAATGYGGGGGGACNDISNAARAGGKGGDGVIIVYEYA